MLTRQQLSSRTRCVLVAVTVTSGAATLGRPLARGAVAPVGTVEEAVVRVCTAGLLLTLAWAWVATVSVVAEAWRGRPGRGPGIARSPLPLRRLVLLCCGVALAGPVGTAAADDRPAPTVLEGLPLPDRAVGPAHRASRTPLAPAPSPSRTVVVRPGDCLWQLAAAHLPDGASATEVTERWQAIHRLNRAVIGPDPDLIHPGQRLVLPSRPDRPRR